MVEACEQEEKGSIGAFYVCHHAALAGYPVDRLEDTAEGYDVELVSVHHCSDFPLLAALPKRARWRIVGGHPMQNNPRPVIPYADAVFIGEAESHIGPALAAVENNGIDGLVGRPGWIVSRDWRRGAALPATQQERPLPNNPPYLNRPGTPSAAWYVEIARGCPYSCHYCDLGHSASYRRYKVENLVNVLDQCDLTKTRKVNFFAPDEASHPQYDKLSEYLKGKGFTSSFMSMRIESLMANDPPIAHNATIRVGIDGLTEATRKRVAKPITDQMIVDYIHRWASRGHVTFKMFMIFGYPWEQLEDFDQWESMMRRVLRVDISKNTHLRVKWTPFIPQPSTPLRDAVPKYDPAMVAKILKWHEMNKRPRRTPGWHVENDGLMSQRSHAMQVRLTQGDERLMLGMRDTLPPLHPSAME
jgi:radical SAM superfamily enzyme YgiQ (UPF0313 family)